MLQRSELTGPSRLWGRSPGHLSLQHLNAQKPSLPVPGGWIVQCRLWCCFPKLQSTFVKGLGPLVSSCLHRTSLTSVPPLSQSLQDGRYKSCRWSTNDARWFVITVPPTQSHPHFSSISAANIVWFVATFGGDHRVSYHYTVHVK